MPEMLYENFKMFHKEEGYIIDLKKIPTIDLKNFNNTLKKMVSGDYAIDYVNNLIIFEEKSDVVIIKLSISKFTKR